MIPILVSACLLGEKVRYDGTACAVQSPHLERWRKEGRLIPVCPEVVVGLPVPRLPSELQPNGKVIETSGTDLTETFIRGAELVLTMAGCAPIAILKNGSPSCGSTRIHDGRFSGVKIPGQGITTRMLRAHGVVVFDETQIDQAAALLSYLEAGRDQKGGVVATNNPSV